MNLAKDTLVRSLDWDTQVAMVAEAREVCEASPLVRPVARGGRPMSVRVTAAGALGWVGDGAYRYEALDNRGHAWPPMPERWSRIASEIAGEHLWDSAIINWYDQDAALGWHQDLSEVDRTLPIITFSLGDACSWAVRRDEKSRASRIRLESGDVTILAGEHRMLHHTVERIIPSPLLSPLSVPGRISITIRVAG